MAEVLLANETPAGQVSELPPPALGMGFYPLVSGTVTKLYFYRPASDTNPAHSILLKLWRSDSVSAGTELASGTILTNPVVAGWNAIPVSVPVVAGTPYKVAANPTQFYGFTGARFAAANVPSVPDGLLLAVQDNTNPLGGWTIRNGTFLAGSGVYPADNTGTFNATWYGVGVEFEPDVRPTVIVDDLADGFDPWVWAAVPDDVVLPVLQLEEPPAPRPLVDDLDDVPEPWVWASAFDDIVLSGLMVEVVETTPAPVLGDDPVGVGDPWGWGGFVDADVVARNPAGLFGPGMLIGGLCGTVEVLGLSGTVEGVACG